MNNSYQLSGQAAVEAKNVPLVQDGVKGLMKNPGFVQLFTQPHPQRMYNEKGELIFSQVSNQTKRNNILFLFIFILFPSFLYLLIFLLLMFVKHIHLQLL